MRRARWRGWWPDSVMRRWYFALPWFATVGPLTAFGQAIWEIPREARRRARKRDNDH